MKNAKCSGDDSSRTYLLPDVKRSKKGDDSSRIFSVSPIKNCWTFTNKQLGSPRSDNAEKRYKGPKDFKHYVEPNAGIWIYLGTKDFIFKDAGVLGI
ncbi:hypothetical protein CEK25_012165 [Fusarium fujikuroi]|nr:hypothetical protein CEK25_012165 [Fusarium fujikuroi]